MLQQIDPWKGDFGDCYHRRQADAQSEAVKRLHLWRNVPALPLCKTFLEVGAGTGPNLIALRKLSDNFVLFALEPNNTAAIQIPPDVSFIYGDATKIEAASDTFDLVFTYGVLIHLEDPLPAMQEMYRTAKRYVLCAEYFSAQRRSIGYRNDIPLYADDFGSLWMDNFNVMPIGTGFCWKRTTGLDNITWWMFEKTAT